MSTSEAGTRPAIVPDRRLVEILESISDAFYDEKGAVGRRYRRQDEAGTPFCMTIDGQTAQDQTVTIRDRDSMKQERVATDKIVTYLVERLSG